MTKTKRANLTAERLREALDYNPETGVFLWKNRTRARALNGGIAGSLYRGYRTIKIDGTPHSAQRLAWLYVHGEWPRQWIDHINGVRDDNRIANLRDVSPQVNAQNHRLRSTYSITGLRGTFPSPTYKDGGNGYIAHIYHGGQHIYIGRFLTELEAAAAYFGAKRILHKGFVPPDHAMGSEIARD